MKTHNENYDLEFLDNVKEEVKVILELCKSNFFHQSISEDEMQAAIMSLNRNKAADFYLIKCYIYFCKNCSMKYLKLVISQTFSKLEHYFQCIKTKEIIKMKKIIKSRENPKILEIQNPLQKGFTEDTTPLLCELLIEEFDNITRAKISSVEWKLADRQLLLKNGNSHSWFMDIKKICLKYDIQQCHQYLGTDHLTSRGGVMVFFF